MTLKEINARIQKVEPLVELVRGEGYHYFVFDNGLDGGDGTTFDPGEEFGDKLVFETESVMVPYLKRLEPSVWISDGIAFGRKIREKTGL